MAGDGDNGGRWETMAGDGVNEGDGVNDGRWGQ